MRMDGAVVEPWWGFVCGGRLLAGYEKMGENGRQNGSVGHDEDLSQCETQSASEAELCVIYRRPDWARRLAG